MLLELVLSESLDASVYDAPETAHLLGGEGMVNQAEVGNCAPLYTVVVIMSLYQCFFTLLITKELFVSSYY